MRPPFGGPPHGRHREGGEGDRRKPEQERSLAEISVTVWLTPENADFYEKNGLLWIKHEDKQERVTLCRQFPFDMLWEYISVLNGADHEIGIIRNVELFGEDTRQLLKSELQKRYYAPVIKKLLSVKERYGFSYWKAETEQGEIRFTLHDTYRSILRVNDRHMVLSDVNGNRFEIPDVEALDPKSRRKLELYL